MRNIAIVALVAATLCACTIEPLGQTTQISDDVVASTAVKVTAVGYGAISNYQGYATGQKRLLAMRASKLDALRSLAEQVYGLRITGNSTVSQMAMKDDGFRAQIDAYIRGARVVSVVAMEDGNYETTVELDYDRGVAIDYTKHVYINPPVTNSVSGEMRGSAGPGNAYQASSFYYSE